MKTLRGSTLSPISSVNTASARVASSIVTRCRVRLPGIHRRLAELVGVHLAEALEPLHRHPVAGQLEHRPPQLVERVGLAASLAEGDRERRPARPASAGRRGPRPGAGSRSTETARAGSVWVRASPLRRWIALTTSSVVGRGDELGLDTPHRRDPPPRSAS